LNKHGIDPTTITRNYEVTKPSQGDDGVSTQILDKNDLEISISLSKVWNTDDEYYLSLNWNWGDQDWDDWGEGPWDILGFAWNNDDWYLPDDDFYTDNKVRYKKSDTTGIAFEFNDPDGDGGAQFYIDAYVHTRGDADPDARQIFADYWHTYSNSQVTSVTISSTDIQITVEDGTKKWHTDTDQSGDRLVISQADA